MMDFISTLREDGTRIDRLVRSESNRAVFWVLGVPFAVLWLAMCIAMPFTGSPTRRNPNAGFNWVEAAVFWSFGLLGLAVAVWVMRWVYQEISIEGSTLRITFAYRKRMIERSLDDVIDIRTRSPRPGTTYHRIRVVGGPTIDLRSSWWFFSDAMNFTGACEFVEALKVRMARRERGMPGRCRQCGYDLRGHREKAASISVCPECGIAMGGGGVML